MHQRKMSHSESFGTQVFSHAVMQKMLPPNIFKNLKAASMGTEKIKPEFSDSIAVAMKEWAMEQGATHFTHWFQPLTGTSAEKHDSFIEWDTTTDNVIEKFTGKQLLQGEPDASSFPSGGLRTTYEARGYTGWDPSSSAFVWRGGDGITLCIPSVFYSWTGDILDVKIPLLRSEAKLGKAVNRILKLTGLEAKRVFATLGLEQEYFVIDRELRRERYDLLLNGRTLFGAPSPKGQELQDHYFGAVKDRILSFMHDSEERGLQLAIPIKTRHNEVAPAQHELAVVFERASVAIDHNILMMELMRQTAEKHSLACLLHEKPFKGLNGSGKHANWSMMTDTGINLLDPTDTPENNLHFLILVTAILNAVHEHSALLRASIGSASNDLRLGGHEAPPAIISVYLGEVLEGLLDEIEKSGGPKTSKKKGQRDLGLDIIPELPQDQTDRNRTSPFAFTGNKFEFRALGSSSNASGAITVLNTIVAESVEQIADELEKSKDIFSVLQKYIKKSRPVRFSGDNYSEAWQKEAKKRNLPNIKKATDAFLAFLDKKTEKAFKGILTASELASRYEVLMQDYIHKIEIEGKTMLEMFKTNILPAALKTQKDLARSIECYIDATNKNGPKSQVKYLSDMAKAIDEAIDASIQFEDVLRKACSVKDLEKKGKAFAHQVSEAQESFRAVVDHLETLCDDDHWTLPKIRELLFLV